MKTKIVKVFSSHDPMKAEIANAILHKHGIRTMEMDKKDSAMVFLGEVELYTAEEDAEKARAILEEAMTYEEGE